MANKQEFLDVIAELDTKIRSLQDRAANAGMSAEEETEIKAALSTLSQLADPAQPNPPPQP